jgi:hypothetical protein
MNNPMQLMQMMKNPQAILQQAMQSGNPIIKNAIEMYQRGDSKGIEELARNLCSEKGTTYEEMLKKFGL